MNPVRINPKTWNKSIWFVRRASDGCMLCVDGLWRSSVCIGQIKFYSSSGRANRYGLAGCKDVLSCAGGNLTTRGSCYAVCPGESVDTEGRIYDECNNWVR